VNRYEQAIFLTFAIFWVLIFGLYHFMILRVNGQLPSARRFPHSGWGHWDRLVGEYKGFYPRTSLPWMMRQCGIAVFVLALAMVGLRIWEYAASK
jgi:hypothetical protein